MSSILTLVPRLCLGMREPRLCLRHKSNFYRSGVANLQFGNIHRGACQTVSLALRRFLHRKSPI
ncbi:Uncharacterized protein dnm_007250 [Desulfonema magnum]|uniref:Uncharacterized protein n=1 Tax=Desulfonema magnum TaxID=45655 RepID=A0A975BG95_9BACT|nr:Uncharacterized protein dnm_007250 [Desulfonema magnum]